MNTDKQTPKPELSSPANGSADDPRREVEELRQKLALQPTEAAVELLDQVSGRKRKLTPEEYAELKENLRLNPLMHPVTVRARANGRYEIILMFRALWETGQIRYQLVDIPVYVLRQIDTVILEAAGKGQSLGADVMHEGERIFHIHFDASDRKCSIRNLGIQHCVILEEWDVEVH